jgi:predicted DNA binding protein
LAVEHEYYGNPRGANLETMAEELSVSRQALAHRLRAAEGKIFDQLFATRQRESAKH